MHNDSEYEYEYEFPFKMIQSESVANEYSFLFMNYTDALLDMGHWADLYECLICPSD